MTTGTSCWLWHTWGKWGTPVQVLWGQGWRTTQNIEVITRHVMKESQTRVCTRCGESQTKVMRQWEVEK